MSRKQKKKDAREQSTRQLMGIDDITDYGIATRMGELVFFAIKPTNISVLPDAGVGARIYALLNVVKGMAEIEMLALNSKESFENNKAFYQNLDDVAAEFDNAHPVLLIENKSVIVTGASMLQVFDRLEVMEMTAASILDAQALGTIAHIPSDEIAALKTAFHLED